MAEILIKGDDAEAAAQAMCAAVREIFETDPIQSTRGGPMPGTRDPIAVATLAITIPIAVVATADLVARTRLSERIRQLIARGKRAKEQTGARIMIDPGDGNHIPIEDAHPDKIREALTALQEKRPKN